MNKNPVHQVVNYFFELKDWDDQPKEFYIENKIYYGRYVKPAKQLLELCDNSVDRAKVMLDRVSIWSNQSGLDWSIETVFKRYLDLMKIDQVMGNI